MGAAACKKSKVAEDTPAKKQSTIRSAKTITIGIFGLDKAGKTSIVKAIDGVPTDDVESTVHATTTTITEPFVAPNNRKSNKSDRSILRIIDVSGSGKARDQTWSSYFPQIHGWIFVVDASERKRWREACDTLTDLLDHEKLKNKPFLILANKQDQSKAINDENDLKDKLDIHQVKQKYRIEFCTAWSQRGQERMDRSLRQGIQWLMRTIEENFSELDSRVTKSGNTRVQSSKVHSDSDEKGNEYRPIDTNRLPSIRGKTTSFRGHHDDDDDDDDIPTDRAINGSLKKKKVLGPTNTNGLVKRSEKDQSSLAFRAPYESFPEETPWTTPSNGKTSRFDETLPRLSTKTSLTNSTRKRDVSPLVHDTKFSTYGSSIKKSYGSDDDDTNDRSYRPGSTTRFDYSNSSTKRSMTTRDYENESSRNRSDVMKSRFDNDDDDDDEKYRTSTREKNSYPYSTSKTTSRSLYDDDDDDPHRYPSTKTAKHSSYDDYSRTNQTSKYDDDENDRYRSAYNSTRYDSKRLTTGHSRSRFDEEDDYSSSKARSGSVNRFRSNADFSD